MVLLQDECIYHTISPCWRYSTLLHASRFDDQGAPGQSLAAKCVVTQLQRSELLAAVDYLPACSRPLHAGYDNIETDIIKPYTAVMPPMSVRMYRLRVTRCAIDFCAWALSLILHAAGKEKGLRMVQTQHSTATKPPDSA